MSEPTYADPDYFERLYARDPDPWRFASSDYERDKYAATIAALPDRRFPRAFEIGCSIGVLTRQLAARCEALVAVDVSAIALDQARERCADQAHVQFAIMDLRRDWPQGRFDLILFSEVLYYLGIDGIHRAARLTRECLAPGGTVVLVNWHGSTGAACTGDRAATTFIADVGAQFAPTLQRREETYRLDVLSGGGSPPADRRTARPTR